MPEDTGQSPDAPVQPSQQPEPPGGERRSEPADRPAANVEEVPHWEVEHAYKGALGPDQKDPNVLRK